MTSDRYTFTREQLQRRLAETVQMFIEHRNQHGHDEQTAADATVGKTLDSLDADLELHASAGEPLRLQLDPMPTEVKTGPVAKSSEMGAVEDS